MSLTSTVCPGNGQGWQNWGVLQEKGDWCWAQYSLHGMAQGLVGGTNGEEERLAEASPGGRSQFAGNSRGAEAEAWRKGSWQDCFLLRAGAWWPATHCH